MKKIILLIACIIFSIGCDGKTSEKTSSESDKSAQIVVKDVTERVNEMNKMNNYETPEGFDTKNDSSQYGELTQKEYYSETTGAVRECYIYTPPNYDPNKTYPVLYLLHGIGGTHTEWLGGAPDEIISNLIASGKVPPMIAVIPNVRAMKNDKLPSEMLGQENINAFDNFINDLRDDLMPFIKENYPISEKREKTAIAGLSMGGREALYIGVSMPDVFGFIGAFSPAPGLLPFSSLNYPGQLTVDKLTLPDKYKKDTFILICNGNQDSVVNNVPDEYSKALSDNEIKHVYYKIDGGHDFDVWRNGLYHFVKNIF